MIRDNQTRLAGNSGLMKSSPAISSLITPSSEVVGKGKVSTILMVLATTTTGFSASASLERRRRRRRPYEDKLPKNGLENKMMWS